MRFYARASWLTVRQVVSDVLLVAWIAAWAWAWAGRTATDLLVQTARPVGETGQVTARLHTVSADPAQAWRDRDPVAIAALARLELTRVGLLPTFGPHGSPTIPPRSQV